MRSISATVTVGRIMNPRRMPPGEPGLPPAQKLDEDDQAEDAEEDRRHAVEHVKEEREQRRRSRRVKVDAVGEGDADRRRQRHQQSGGDQDQRADHVVKHAPRRPDEADLLGEKLPTDGGQAAERNRCEDRQQRRAGNRRARKRQRGKQAVSESAGVHGLLPPSASQAPESVTAATMKNRISPRPTIAAQCSESP